MSNQPPKPDTLEISTEELVSRCIEGDRHYQRFLFKKYKNNVYALIVHYLGPNYDLDDIVQQVFINIFRSLSGFKGLSSLDTWIYRITSKICIDQIRKKYRKRHLTLVNNTEFVERASSDGSDDVLQSQERKELVSQIYEAMDKLNKDKRTVIVLFEMEGLSLDEIAKILKKPVGTIKSRLFHGRKELATHLKKYLQSNL